MEHKLDRTPKLGYLFSKSINKITINIGTTTFQIQSKLG